MPFAYHAELQGGEDEPRQVGRVVVEAPYIIAAQKSMDTGVSAARGHSNCAVTGHSGNVAYNMSTDL